MRSHVSWHALGGALAGLLLVLPAATSAVATDHHNPEIHRAKPHVKLLSSAWTVQSTPQALEVRTTYPKSTPPKEYVGQPVDIQVMRSDASWMTVGTAEQKRVDDESRTTATVEFTFPDTGRIRIRARAHQTSGTVKSRQALVTVRAEPARFNPTALPGTGGRCTGPTIGSLKRIVYSCLRYHKRRERAVAYNHVTGTQRAFAPRRAETPIIADNAPVAISDRRVKQYSAYYRGLRTSLRTRNTRPIAYKRNGEVVHDSDALSISADGRRIVYASNDRGIVKDAPNGTNIYLNRQGHRRSTFIAHGHSAQISGDGRFIVWRTRDNDLRRLNLETGRTVKVPGAHLYGPRANMTISRTGRYIAYTEVPGDGGRRQVRIVDMRRGKTWDAGRGVAPVLSPNGSMVAFKTAYDTKLMVWSRRTKSRTLINVGRDGNGSGVLESWSPDFSANGRWLVAHADSALVAPDNGRGDNAWNDIVLFDLAELKGEAR